MSLFIDTATGTWGMIEDLVFLSDEDSRIFLSCQDERSDSEIIAFGEENGDAPILSQDF